MKPLTRLEKIAIAIVILLCFVGIVATSPYVIKHGWGGLFSSNAGNPQFHLSYPIGEEYAKAGTFGPDNHH